MTNVIWSDQIAFLVSGHINLCESLKLFTSMLLVHFPIGSLSLGEHRENVEGRQERDLKIATGENKAGSRPSN